MIYRGKVPGKPSSTLLSKAMQAAGKPDAFAKLLGEQDAEDEAKRDREAMAKMAFDGPAVFANRFQITAHADVVRISFGDQHRTETEPKFRTAVALSSYDAQQLVEILGSFLGNSPMEDETSEVPGSGA